MDLELLNYNNSSNSNQVIDHENANILTFWNSHITLGNMQYVCGNSLQRYEGSLPNLENKSVSHFTLVILALKMYLI